MSERNRIPLLQLFERLRFAEKHQSEQKASKIDEYGGVLTPRNRLPVAQEIIRPIDTATTPTYQDFLSYATKFSATRIEAQVDIKKIKCNNQQGINDGLYSHVIHFQAVIPDHLVISLRRDFGDFKGNPLSQNGKPYNDLDALITYLTAGELLLAMKHEIPSVKTQLTSSNSAVKLTEKIYRDLLEDARKKRSCPREELGVNMGNYVIFTPGMSDF